MDDKNTAYLINKYPELIKDSFWFEVGDGWTNLLDTMLGEMKYLTNTIPGGAIIQIDQVKSKFGGLRVYWSLHSEHNMPYAKVCEHFHNAVSRAEITALHTCANCSAHGNVSQTSRWADRLCNVCKEGESILCQQATQDGVQDR